MTAERLGVDAVLRRAARTVNRVLGRRRAGRRLTVYPDDVFVVSYPRSGNTWLRFLIANLYSRDHPATFRNIEQKIPDIYLHADRRLREFPRPRILKSHEPYDPRYRRVVYVVRDPRDVAVSYYHYRVAFGGADENRSLAPFAASFADGAIDAFGSWGDHVRGWIASRHDPDLLLVRYEDLLAEPIATLRPIAALAGIDADESALARAVELSSATRMRRLEEDRASDGTRAASEPDRRFVRTAASGAGKRELAPESLRVIESAWPHLSAELGYADRGGAFREGASEVQACTLGT